MASTHCSVLIRNALTLAEREQLVAIIDHEPGINHAFFSYPEKRRLNVYHESSAFSLETLVDVLKRQRLDVVPETRDIHDIDRVLVAIDDSVETTRTLDYVGRIVKGRANLHVCLYSRLPGLPSQLREHGGSEDPIEESRLSQELSEAATAWLEEQQEIMRPLLDAARSRLLEAGIDSDAISREHSWDASAGESLAAALMRVARASGCHTIAVGRHHSTHLLEKLHRHTSDALSSSAVGFALWIIE